MKFSKSPKFRGNLTFYTVIACCLIAIGGASYLAFSKPKTKINEMPDNSSYKKDTSSYNESEINQENTTPEADVKNTVSDVPYEESQSQTESTDKEEKQVFVLPTEGKVIKNYSDTALQYSSTYADMRLHLGFDIECAKDSNVKSISEGTVVATDNSADYGGTVTIDHKNGIKVKYCGLKDIKLKTGQKVNAGDVIGICDTVPCECMDPSHIHIEATVNDNPISVLEIIGLNQ